MAKAFGTEFMPEMAINWFKDNQWGTPEFVSSDSLPLHPASHVLHYSSTCFEGLKAFRQKDGYLLVTHQYRRLPLRQFYRYERTY